MMLSMYFVFPVQVRMAMRGILQCEATDTGKQAQERFNAVMRAYRVLSDPGARAVYDRRGKLV